MQVWVQDGDTSAEQRALLALWHQPNRHGLSDLCDCQSACLVGFNDGHVNNKSASRTIGQRGHRPGYYWG